MKKLVAAEPVHQLHDDRGFQRRKREQKQERRHELRPDEERQPHPGHPLCAQLNDRRDEINRAEQRRGDQENKTNQPESLPVPKMDDRLRSVIRDDRERRIGGPAALGRSTRDEKADEHDDATEQRTPGSSPC